MAISKLAQLTQGLIKNVDLTAEELQVLSITIGGASGTNLTKAQLDTLISNSHAPQSDNQNVVAGDGLSGGGSGATVNLAVTADVLRDADKGANNGVASLDAGGKIPAAQLPSSVMEYKGTWNASTNSPTLADGTGDAGDVYIVSTAGSQDLGSGSITFAVGDWVIYNGSTWEKSLNSNAVVSVNSQTGVVVLDSDDISEGSTNLYYTDARFDTRLATKDTDDLTEGSTNKYYSSTLFNSDFSGKSTSDLSEGTNLYYTQARFDSAFSAKDTDDLTEGSTNLYFTDTRAKTAAVVNSTAGSETDQAASVSAMKSYVSSQIGSADDIVRTMVAGESFAQDTAFAVRMAVNGETSGRVYKLDITAADAAEAHVIGMVYPDAAKSDGDDIDVYMLGEIDSSVDFTASQDEGKPVFIDASGNPTLTAPSTAGHSVVQVGMVSAVGASASKVMVQAPRLVYIA